MAKEVTFACELSEFSLSEFESEFEFELAAEVVNLKVTNAGLVVAKIHLPLCLLALFHMYKLPVPDTWLTPLVME
jgi:hypothetical protein